MTNLTHVNHSKLIKATGINPYHYWKNLKFHLSQKSKKNWFEYIIGQLLWSGPLAGNKPEVIAKCDKVEKMFPVEYNRAIDSIREYTKNW